MLKNLLLLSGFSTFVVIAIIALNVYHNYTLSTLPENTQQHIKSISPNFDTATLNDLKKRQPINVSLNEKSSIISDDSRRVVDASAPTPTPETNPTPVASTVSGSLNQGQL